MLNYICENMLTIYHLKYEKKRSHPKQNWYQLTPAPPLGPLYPRNNMSLECHIALTKIFNGQKTALPLYLALH